MDDEPSGVPAELPADYRAFRRPYRWPLMYGPWALGVIGLVMIGVGLFGDRPGGVALTSIGFGAAMVIAGVLLPRMQGQLELGPSGVKGAVHGLPTPFMVAAVTAREVAEETIPADEPDRNRRVNEIVDEAVGRAANYWVTPVGNPRTPHEPPTREEVGMWAIEAIDQILATQRNWTEEERRQWFRAKRLDQELRRRLRKPPDDQDDEG